MLSHSDVGQEFWTETVNTVSFLVNRSSSITIESKTLFKVWSESLTEYSQLRGFGCLAHAYVRDGKLESMVKKCIFLEYTYGVKGFRLWCSDSKFPRLIINKDVISNESFSLDNQKRKIIAESNHDIR